MEFNIFITILTFVLLSDGNEKSSAQKVQFNIEPRAGEDGGSGSENSNNAGDVSTSISYLNCHLAENCCFQYTWPGVVEDKDIPLPVNNTCEWYKKAKGASTACFDPFVYTNNDDLKETGPPLLEELVEGSQNRDDWHIYCRKSAGKSCVKYRFYTNNKEKTLINETLFCGSVTETTSNKMIKNGCYKEKSSGTVKEICICDNHLCNSALPIYKFLTFPTLILFSLITFIYHSSSLGDIL